MDDYSFLASLVFGLKSVDPRLRYRVTHIALRANHSMPVFLSAGGAGLGEAVL